MTWFKRWFEEDKYEPVDKMGIQIYNMWEHIGWGNRISWSYWEHRKINGHLPYKLKPGDEIRSRMQSGKIARFRVTEVEYCGDPKDMFFATVEDVGYLEDAKEFKSSELRM